MMCKDCKGTTVKSRTNYGHGKKSNATTSYVCRDCGSSNIEMPERKRFGRRR